MKSPDSSQNSTSKSGYKTNSCAYHLLNFHPNASAKLPAIALVSSLATCMTLATAAIAGNLPERNLWGKPTCDVSRAEILRKHELRKAALLGQGDSSNSRSLKAQSEYQAIIQNCSQIETGRI